MHGDQSAKIVREVFAIMRSFDSERTGGKSVEGECQEKRERKEREERERGREGPKKKGPFPVSPSNSG
jgi:hypothetical protein